jgi:hypothetical protein
MSFSRITMAQAAASFWKRFKDRFPKGDIVYFPSTSGVLETTANVNIPSTLDGDTVFRTYDDLVINSGHTLTVTNRCKGLCIHVRGDCVINGVLSMTARGAHAEGSDIVIDPLRRFLSFATPDYINFPFFITAQGGPGGGAYKEGGFAAPDFSCGGGGAGAGAAGAQPNWGSAGTSFSGGSGGGSTVYDRGETYSVAKPNGGEGGGSYGAGSGHPCGSGAGNPAGPTSNGGQPGQHGTGGMLVLVVDGSLVIGSTGRIEANGMNGGNGNTNSRGGGSSGGGNISVFHRGSLTNSGDIRANGGISIWGGGAGGPGSIRVIDI